jgi:hypothetical protein
MTEQIILIAVTSLAIVIAFYAASMLDKIGAIKAAIEYERMISSEIDSLVEQTKGRFFSIEFQKKDGSIRKINGKDKYRRLLRGGENNLKKSGYVSFVNRNAKNVLNPKGGAWASVHKDSLVTFRCGDIVKELY